MDKNFLEKKIKIKEENGLSAAAEYIELLAAYYHEIDPEQIQKMASFEKEAVLGLLHRIGPHKIDSKDFLQRAISCGITLVDEYRQVITKQFPIDKPERDSFYYQIAYINKLLLNYCDGAKEGELNGYNIEDALKSTNTSETEVLKSLCELERLLYDCLKLLLEDDRNALLTAYCYIDVYNTSICD